MTRVFTDDELKEIVKTIAQPTFKYLMKRVSSNILDDKHKSKMDIATFMSIICAAIASIDANTLRWLENFHEIQSGKRIDFDKLKNAHTRNLYDQLNIILQ